MIQISQLKEPWLTNWHTPPKCPSAEFGFFNWGSGYDGIPVVISLRDLETHSYTVHARACRRLQIVPLPSWRNKKRIVCMRDNERNTNGECRLLARLECPSKSPSAYITQQCTKNNCFQFSLFYKDLFLPARKKLRISCCAWMFVFGTQLLSGVWPLKFAC